MDEAAEFTPEDAAWTIVQQMTDVSKECLSWGVFARPPEVLGVEGDSWIQENFEVWLDTFFSLPDATGDTLTERLLADEDLELADGVPIHMRPVVAIAYAAGAINLYRKGLVSDSWRDVLSAQHYKSFFHGMLYSREVQGDVLAKAIDARHAENRSMRADAIDWYLKNRDRDGVRLTKDDAAAEIAGKVVPMTFRTVRGWLSKVRD